MKYISLMVSTFPPNEPHLDLKTAGVIQPSVIHYSPIFVKRITEFTKFSISDENSDRAL